ncbi:hypothetical protein TRAPUB_5426, partial [Trametes pubescens]
SDMEARPIVNVDVFRLILAYLPHRELLMMALASKFSREEATQHLLMRPMSLLRNHKLLTFCQFALTGDLSKLSYLRELTIKLVKEPFSSEDRAMVARVLAHCVNLRRLGILWCDMFIMDEPVSGIPEAISALPSLAYLTVQMHHDDQQIRDVLIRMVLHAKASLRGLHLPMFGDGLSRVEVLRDLARVHSHLEDFTLQFSTFTAPGVTFSAVRNLHLILEKNLPQLRDVYNTFPNVHELTIDYYMHLGETPPNAARVEDQRNGSCWPSLDLLCACPLIIRALGIVCPVRRLSLGFCDYDLDEEITETVSRLRPSKLTLDLRCGPDWVVPLAHPSLMLHSSRDAGVKHLFVKKTLTGSRRSPATTSSFMDWILPLLFTARVELLHVAISKSFESDSDDPQEVLESARAVIASSNGPDIDAEALAGDLARACASIRTVAITIAPIGHTVWSVDRADGEARVVKLDAFEGRRVWD